MFLGLEIMSREKFGTKHTTLMQATHYSVILASAMLHIVGAEREHYTPWHTRWVVQGGVYYNSLTHKQKF